MAYKIDFIGLIDFFNMATQEPLLLMPDGREPGRNIDRHFAGVWVHQDQVAEDTEWWPLPEQDPQLEGNGVVEYRIMEPARIRISGQEEGVIDASGFTEKVPILRDRAPAIKIDPEKAATIAQVPIRRGTLTAQEVQRAIIGELNVPDHQGQIRITATPLRNRTFEDGTTEMVLVLNELPTEDLAGGRDRFFIANFSNKDVRKDDPDADHFQIYRQLDSGGSVDHVDTPTEDEILALGADRFFSNHPFGRHLSNGLGVVNGSQCSVTGCCRNQG